MIVVKSYIYRCTFFHPDSNLADGRSVCRQESISGWVLSLARKTD